MESAPVRGQLSVFLVLGVLTVLSLGGAAWSAFTGPKVADVQLHEAAANTVAASSMVVVQHATIKIALPTQPGSTGGTAENETETISETVDYQAPDRIRASSTETGAGSEATAPVTSTETQIGDACWTNVPAGDDTSCTAKAISSFFTVVSGLEQATDVTERGGTYFLSPKASASVVQAMDGGQGNSVFGTASGDSIEARITGDTISWEQVNIDSTGSTAGTSVDIVITYSDIGSAPPVETPSGPPTATG
jgi:hypothetical protein